MTTCCCSLSQAELARQEERLEREAAALKQAGVAQELPQHTKLREAQALMRAKLEDKAQLEQALRASLQRAQAAQPAAAGAEAQEEFEEFDTDQSEEEIGSDTEDEELQRQELVYGQRQQRLAEARHIATSTILGRANGSPFQTRMRHCACQTVGASSHCRAPLRLPLPPAPRTVNTPVSVTQAQEEMRAILGEKARLEEMLRQVRTRIATCFTTLISYQDYHMLS